MHFLRSARSCYLPMNRRILMRNCRLVHNSFQRANKQTIVSTQEQSEYISVPEFFRDRTVFITGATGFLGQGLVEKLLRSCPDVGQIILPIRVSRKGGVEERYRTFLQQQVFERVSRINPRFEDKLMPIQVDLSRSDLGLSKDDHDRLINRVSVVVHAAADTKLNPPLSEVMSDNFLTTVNVMAFAQACLDIKAFVYVSSGFTNMHLDLIKEEVYPVDVSMTDMVNLARKADGVDPRVEFDTHGSQMNYLFSKRVAEQHVAESRGDLSVVISRPCMITAAIAEPFPMWTSGYGSYNGTFQMLANKTLPYILGDPKVKQELVPVDIVVNSIITSAWLVGTGQQLETCDKGPIVINLHSTDHNGITVGDLVEIVNGYYAVVEKLTFRLRLIQNNFIFRKLSMLRCLPTCLLRDMMSMLKGRKGSKTKRLLIQLSQLQALSPLSFTNNKREYKNSCHLASRLSELDQKVFNTDLREHEWRSYMFQWLEACKHTDISKR